MVNLNGHEVGNGGYSQRTPKACLGLLYSEGGFLLELLRISTPAIATSCPGRSQAQCAAANVYGA